MVYTDIGPKTHHEKGRTMNGFEEKRRNWRRIWIIATTLLIIPIIWLSAQAVPQRTEVLSHLVREGLSRWHYTGKPLDEQTGRDAMNEYVRFLDFGKRFLLASDAEQIRQYGQKLTRSLQSGDLTFIDQALALVHGRMDAIWAFIDPIFQSPQSFELSETLELDSEKRDYFATMAELKAHWRQYVRQRILQRMYDLWKEEKGEKDKPKGMPIKSDLIRLELKAREEVRKIFVTYFKRVREIQSEDKLGRFFNAMLSVFDPHTSYFAPRDEEDFNIEMSGSFEGIGALLGERDDHIQVMQIIVGGPSWRDQRLEVGDKFLKVAQGDAEPVDLTGMRVTDAVKLIRGKKGTRLTLTVKKPDGRVEKIVLQRDIVVVEETFARSSVFTDPDKKVRYGYIFLPSFYNDFSGKTKRNSADDVRQAVLDLKASNISGLVLDLRGNGGGALDDAIRISGLFIDEGPVLQVKNRQQGVKVFNDPEPGSIYDGPLVVLIDAVSASASEIVAAALQDYRRAVIIGGKQSFGKGTVQILLDLDEFIRDENPGIKPLGAIKMTVQTFYRVSGDTNQFKGVVPDIVLPASNDYLKIGERYYDYPIKPQVIDPAPFKPVKTGLDLDGLKKNSRERVERSRFFGQIKRYIEILKERQADSSVPLDWKSFFDKQEKEQAMVEGFNTMDPQVRFSVQALGADIPADGDRLAKERKLSLDNWLRDLRKDAYVEEALWVLSDMLALSGV
jgi:carboxyl-terminal processing protease